MTIPYILNIQPVVGIDNQIGNIASQQLTLTLIPVLKGDSGGTDEIFVGTFIASQNIAKGFPVYILKSNGQLGVADSGFYTKSYVIGYAVEDTLTGFPVDVYKGQLTMPDWTSVSGASTLSVGQTYFLNVNGGITTATPSAIPASAAAVVGVATTSITLDVSPTYPILL